MRKTKLIGILLGSLSTILAVSCGGGSGGGNSSDPNIGFNVRTVAVDPAVGIEISTGGTVEGTFLQANGTIRGSVESFTRTTSGGDFTVTGAKVPAKWRLTLRASSVFPPPMGLNLCTTPDPVEVNVNPGGTVTAKCFSGVPFFTATPGSIDVQNQPSSIQLSGSKGLRLTYGTPVVIAYDEFGNVVGSTSSIPIYSSGLLIGLAVPLPDLSNAHDGTYTLTIHNMTADGKTQLVGATVINIYGNPIIIIPDPGDGGCLQSPPNQPQLPCEQTQV